MKNWMMKNSGGEPDAMFTLSIVSFVVVSFMVVMSLFKGVSLFGISIEFNEVNVPLLTLYLGTCFSSYVFRRTTKDKLANREEEDLEECAGIALGEEVDDLKERLSAFEETVDESIITNVKQRSELKDANMKLSEAIDRQKLATQEVRADTERKIGELLTKINRLDTKVKDLTPAPKLPEVF